MKEKFYLTLFIQLIIIPSMLGFEVKGECQNSIPVEGVVSIEGCDSKTDKCVNASAALYDYSEKFKDDDAILTVAIQSSPWRMYDEEMRILRISELASVIKPHLNDKTKSVLLVASWSGVRPDSKTKSLSEKLSASLNGFPVSGMDGFLWLKNDGDFYTTKQAFTLRGNGPYKIKHGDDVMQSLVSGWLVENQEIFVKERNAEGVMRAAAAWDIFMLCPDSALQGFEEAAALSNSIAAYNAAVMRMERGGKSDLEVASRLLEQAVKAGDNKAKILLNTL